MNWDFENVKKKNLIFTEIISKKLKIPYILLAIILTIWNVILVYLVIPSGRDELVRWFIEDYGFLFFIPIFWLIITMKIIKNMSLKLFLKPGMPFPADFKGKIRKYLDIVFFPYRIKKPRPKEFLFFVNHLYFSIFVGLIMGIISFLFARLDYRNTSLLDSILGSGIGAIIPCTINIIMAFYIVGIILILKQLWKSFSVLKNKGKLNITMYSINKLEEMKKIPTYLVFSYIGYMIAIPSLTIATFKGDLELIGYGILIIIGLIGFFIL